MISFIKNDDEWEPDETDIAWAANMVTVLKEGGTWGAPGSGQVFKFFHSLKEIHLIHGDPSHEWFDKSKICFKKVGYKVLNKT